ncbi:transferase [Xylogone sp. PMI_703]|nr:transferase [Xylogone sp. PMI_703]
MFGSTAKITITATHVVQSAHPISLEEPFILGPFDQLGHFATPINVVWIYESSSVDLIPLERLHKALSRLLDYYPQLTGRLHINHDTDARSITRIGTGIQLLEASCDASLQSFARSSSASNREFSVFDFPGAGNALLTPWDLSLDGRQREPLLTIQRTKLACSAVAIGMRISHAVCGAGGFLGLYQDLAEIYRATDPERYELASPPYLPSFMATQMLHMDAEERQKVLAERPPRFSLRDDDVGAARHAENEARFQENLKTDPIVGQTLRFSPSALAKLKGLAVDPERSGSARMSAFAALSAHLWQRIHLARLGQAKSSPNNEKTSAFSSSAFGTVVSFVPHLGLHPRSFANMVVTPFVVLDSTKLAQAPLWEISKTISDQIRDVSEDEVRKLGSWIAAQPKKSHIHLDFPSTRTSFIASGWHRFPLYSGAELDVAPTFASPVYMETMLDGMVYFLEPKARDGGLEAIASLKSSTWEALDKDVEFITTWDNTG